MTERPTLVVGLMSGTSLDGMDAALVRFASPTDASLVAFTTRPFSAAERDRLAAALVGGAPRDYAHLHALVADWAIEAVEALLDVAHVPASALDGIGFPGQTLWHEPPAVTWQLGDPARVAERFGVRVVSDFRARDLAAGGQCPLQPCQLLRQTGAPPSFVRTVEAKLSVENEPVCTKGPPNQG